MGFSCCGGKRIWVSGLNARTLARKNLVIGLLALLADFQSPIAIEIRRRVALVRGRPFPVPQVDDADVLQDQVAAEIRPVVGPQLLGVLHADKWRDRTFHQSRHLLQIAASLGERLDNLIDPTRALVRLDHEVGCQNQKRNDELAHRRRKPSPASLKACSKCGARPNDAASGPAASRRWLMPLGPGRSRPAPWRTHGSPAAELDPKADCRATASRTTPDGPEPFCGRHNIPAERDC